jgi:hypothetical protein
MLAAICLTESQRALAATAKPLRRRLISRSDVKARRAMSESKKRHVKSLTRLPTKRMATACWAFIVVKTTRLETAPMLDFSSLQAANSESHPQFIHNTLWMGWGLLRCPAFVAQTG